jgi:VanZ family protein
MESRLQPALAPHHASQPPHSATGGTLRRAFWAVAIAGLIFAASSRSHVVSPGITRIDDKFAHFAIYGLLATLVCRIGAGWRWAIVAFLLVALFGASDEWHQSYVPGRSTDFGDWIADTFGAALAIALYAGWPVYRRWLETPIRLRRRRTQKDSAVPPSGLP